MAKEKLKVYRTPIGFHDAYVAAPSQKEALQAWGTDRNLFARGVAERVEDPDLTREPLARPREVIKRSRGSAAEQIAALPKSKPKTKRRKRSATMPPAPQRKPAERKPKPSRATLDAAQRAVTEAEVRHRDQERKLRRREAAIEHERRTMEAAQAKEIAKLTGAAERAGDRYRRAMDAWEG